MELSDAEIARATDAAFRTADFNRKWREQNERFNDTLMRYFPLESQDRYFQELEKSGPSLRFDSRESASEIS